MIAPSTPTKRRRNFLLWTGFLLVLLAVATYLPIFAVFAATRDIPWVNDLLFLAGGALMAIGLRRAFRLPELYRGKILGSILAALALLLFALFSYGVLVGSKDIPAAVNALQVGQPAPDFRLASADGKQFSLSDEIKNNRAVLLIFYRGYW